MGLKLAHLPGAPVGPRDVRVQLQGGDAEFPRPDGRARQVPGERLSADPGLGRRRRVLETGADVTRFRPGDRVTTSFFPHWSEGRASRAKFAGALGGGGKGTLAEEIVLAEDALIASPPGLSFAQAASLTCAGTTAWNALFVTGNLKAGETVVLLGTGGVSIWALQLAKAAGARVIITSSSDEKLARARALGADHTVNYRTTPAVERRSAAASPAAKARTRWSRWAARRPSNSRSPACASGGAITVIGAVSGMGGGIAPRSLITTNARFLGVYVGSRAMHEDLARTVAINAIEPVVDRVFAVR